MLKFSEADLQNLLVMLYHDTDTGFKLWKKAESAKVPISVVMHMMTTNQYGNELRLDTPHRDAIIQMNTVFAAL
jgi:hypothetical protein